MTRKALSGRSRGLLAPLLRRAGWLKDWVRRRRRRGEEAHGLVLMYHRVAAVPVDPWQLAVRPENFDDQLRVLARHADIVPLPELHERLRAGRHSRPVIALTFDDGYLDNLEVAKPMLERYEAPATVFIATGFVGRQDAFWWDRLANAILLPDALPAILRLGEGDPGFAWDDPGLASRGPASWSARSRLHGRLWEWLAGKDEPDRGVALGQIEDWARARHIAPDLARPMAEQEIRQLANGGLITVGAHSVGHPRLTRLSGSARRREIAQSRSDCRRILGHEPSCFAFPHGDYDAECIDLVRETGFAVACTTRADLAWASGDRLQVPRILARDVNGDMLLRGLRRAWLQ